MIFPKNAGNQEKIYQHIQTTKKFILLKMLSVRFLYDFRKKVLESLQLFYKFTSILQGYRYCFQFRDIEISPTNSSDLL